MTRMETEHHLLSRHQKKQHNPYDRLAVHNRSSSPSCTICRHQHRHHHHRTSRPSFLASSSSHLVSQTVRPSIHKLANVSLLALVIVLCFAQSGVSAERVEILMSNVTTQKVSTHPHSRTKTRARLQQRIFQPAGRKRTCFAKILFVLCC